MLKTLSSETITETEKESKTIEKDEGETEMDTDEPAATETKDEISELESTSDK